jgi:hypothetical protein
LFSGKIPYELTNLPNIEILALQRSKTAVGGGLTGKLPSFENSPNLQQLHLSYNKLDGSIPSSFLKGVTNKDREITVDLTGNRIEGSIPLRLTDFTQMSLYLGDNEINGIDEPFCNLGGWMGGQVEEDGCDAILCPAGTYNTYGRQTSEGVACQPCPFTFTAMFYGSTVCDADTTEYNEREILIKFYDSTGGSNWRNADNWKEDSVSICDWYGVFCESEDYEDGQEVVLELHLPSNKLVGTVPPQVFGLEKLKMLNLRDNKDLDVEFQGIGHSAALRELYLDATKLSSLSGLGRAKNLRTLHLQQNDLGGASLPEEMFGLTKLEHLHIADANIGGTLSTSLGRLTNLQEIFW